MANQLQDNFSVGAPAAVAPAGADSFSTDDQASAPADNFSVGSVKSGDTPPADQTATDQPPAAPEDTTDYSKMGWGEVAGKALNKTPESAMNLVKGIGSSIYNYDKTLGSIKDIGSGLLSKAEGAIGVEQDPKKKDEAEALVNALGNHYKDTYGGLLSGDTSGLKKELVNDPMSPLMDVATVLSGGELAAAKAPGMLGKIGELSGKLGSAIDPVQNALRVAKVAAKPITYPIKKIVPLLQAGATGVPKNMLDMAGEAATTKNPAYRDAFHSTMTGSMTPEQTNDIIRNSLDDINRQNSADYVAGKQALTASGKLQPLDWKNVTDALDSARKATRTTDPSTGEFMIKDAAGDKMLDTLEEEIRGTPPTMTSPGTLGYMNAPAGSPFHTLQGFDDLKQKIGNLLYDRNLSPKTKANIGQLYGAAKKSITDVYPDYEKLMEASQQNILQMKDLMSQAGKDTIPATKQFAKVMLSTRKGDDTLLSALAKQDGRIPYLLAGHTMHDWLPNRLRTAIAANPLTLFALFHNPTLIPALLAGSPKAMGKLNYNVARMSKLPSKATLPVGVAAEQLSKVDENRQGRKFGGQVGNPEKEAERLIFEAGKARKQHEKITSPLLNQSDEAITKALAIANQSI